MLVINLALIISGYLLGSIPSAYIVGKAKQHDMLQYGDGRMGTSLAYHKLGLLAGLTTGLLDFGKGVISIAIALLFHAELPVVLLAGLAAVTGHNWSIFLGFKGGRGSMVGYGVLAVLMPLVFVIAVAMGGFLFYFTRRPTLSTVVIVGMLPVILWVQDRLRWLPEAPWERDINLWLIVFPLSLFIPIFIKVAQIHAGNNSPDKLKLARAKERRR